MNLLLNILSVFYAATGVAATIGYFPTIKDLLRGKMSSNNHSYIIWATCGLIVFLYSLFILPDPLFIMVSGLNFICCALILILGLSIKQKKPISEQKKKF
jgi:hypothetical protein